MKKLCEAIKHLTKEQLRGKIRETTSAWSSSQTSYDESRQLDVETGLHVEMAFYDDRGQYLMTAYNLHTFLDELSICTFILSKKYKSLWILYSTIFLYYPNLLFLQLESDDFFTMLSLFHKIIISYFIFIRLIWISEYFLKFSIRFIRRAKFNR